MNRKVLSFAVVFCMTVAIFFAFSEISNALSVSCPSVSVYSKYDKTVTVEWGDTNGSSVQVYNLTTGTVNTVSAYSHKYTIDHDITSGQTVEVRIRAYEVITDSSGNRTTYYSSYSPIYVVTANGADTGRVYQSAISLAKTLKLNTCYGGTSKEWIPLRGEDSYVYYHFRTSPRTDSKYRISIYSNEKSTYYEAIAEWGINGDIVAYGTDVLPEQRYVETLSLKPNTTYTFRVHATYYYNWTANVDYRLMVSEIVRPPARPTITVCNGGKRMATFRFGKIANASRYQVAYRINGGQYRYFYTQRLSNSIRNLASNRKCTILVRSQRLANGRFYSSPWSISRTVRVK